MKRQLNSKKAQVTHGLALILALVASTALTACKGGGLFNGKLFMERAAEKPAPTDEGIEKSFFVNADGKPKTFLCAVAPEVARGDESEEIFHSFANETAHCNVEFQITENNLVGKLVHPSFLNDRSRWVEMIKIPIKSHYYFERQKDAHGRETNEFVENTSRSHWSARPMMKLDLSGISFSKFGTVADGSPTSVEDIEWDREKNFLGFSINAQQMVVAGYRAVSLQARYRVNFLKFDHDPTFEKVPFNRENSRYFNILHVLGRKIEGTEQELYAGHWDFRQPHTLYLNGVPSAMEPIVRGAIEKWNVALREIGAIGKDKVAFKVEVRNSKHPFDLRYPAINWISDRRISAKAPLGIGMAHADVRNGKILWGGITLWGGILETYINHYTPIESAGTAMVAGMTPFQSFAPMIKSTMRPMEMLDQNALARLTETITADQISHYGLMAQALEKDPRNSKQLQTVQEAFARYSRKEARADQIVVDAMKASRDHRAKVDETFSYTNVLKMLNQRMASDPGMNPTHEQIKAKPDLGAALREKDLGRRSQILRGMNNINVSASFVESEYTAENMAPSWLASPAQRTRSYPDMLESVVMELTLHEFGHMIGLGHQFKENIVPEKDSVPSHFVTEMAELATKEKGFTNYSSVMGYRSGRVEMLIPEKDLKPGPHDKLVLRYLYRNQYSVYDKSKDDFAYFPVPATGKIPAVTNSLPVSYFPQCNDFEASLDADPFCNRWDHGSSAQDIMRSYFEHISDNLLASLYNVVGGGGNHWYYEYRMWNLALGQFSRARLFYDEMRRRLRSEPDLIPLWDRLRQDTDALLEFAPTCMKENPTGAEEKEVLRDLFAHKDILDLCRANKIALDEFEFFLNLPDADYTKLDSKNRYVSGGYLEGDAGREHAFDNFMGAWYQLSNFPLKFSAMFTLTTANPYQFDAYYGITPNYYFNSEENRYLYRTLYPRDYTKLISSSVQNNMRFTALGLSPRNTIGKTILATNSLLPYQRYTSNDAARLPNEYNKMLDQQTKFELSVVAILISPQVPEASSGVKADYYKKFSAKIYDLVSSSKTSASEVYVLPRGNVIVKAPNMFLLPITQMKFYEKLDSYVIAYKVSFDKQEGDKLVEDSVKYAINDKHNEILNQCITGFKDNGLRGFFNNTSVKDAKCEDDKADGDFQGFYIPPLIAQDTNTEKTRSFYTSIDEEFKRFERRSSTCGKIPAHFPLKSMTTICNEALAGVSVVSSTAALLNGIWFEGAADWLEK